MKKIALIFLVMVNFLACEDNKVVAEKTTDYLLKNVPSETSGIDFTNFVTENEKNNIINYIYFYNGAGVAVGDVNNDGLPDLFFVSNQEQNKLYLNRGDLKFEDVTATANLNSNASWQTGVTMVDINNDGWLDIYVCAVSGLLDFEGHNELFINNGDGTFTEDAASYGLDVKGYSTQAYFFDYDKDNDLDVYIVNHAVHTTLSHGRAELREQREPLVGDVLLNNDNGKFSDVSETANIYGGVNGYGLSATIADFNNDGWDDIYVCNDFHEDDYYYINTKDGRFREELADAFTTISRFSMGSDAADINGDGFQDLITLDMLPKDERLLKETEGDDAMFNMQVHLTNLGYKDQYSRNMLQLNHRGAYFQETALINEIADTDWSWAPLLADFDNDGHQDLYISNGILRRPNSLDFKKYVSSAFKGRDEAEGLKWLYNSISEMPDGNVPNEIFRGNSVKFESKTGDWIEERSQLSNGAIYADLDLDGDLDIVTNNFNEPAALYENTKDTLNNYLALDFNYKDNNKEGIGLKAILYANETAQLKQVFKSRGFMSSLDSRVHFGLGNQQKVDSLVIIWPDNSYQTLSEPEINKVLDINYAPQGDYVYAETAKDPLFKKEDMFRFTHEEDNYNDFAEQKLIPYKVSTFGPAMAIGDVDQNGYEDIYIGNSSGKAGQLLLNSGTGFIKSTQPALNADLPYEDNAAAFFDADNDGDLDLYVGSGVNLAKQTRFEKDRLYLNNKGVFSKTENRIPEINTITTAVAAYDFDQDGDEDLFVGQHSERGDFGKTVPSYLLINDGKGNFSKDDTFNLLAMVTDAEWSDVNGDNVKDLLVASEWGHPNIFLNTNGSLKQVELTDSLNGLWQSISTFDMDGDGDLDIVCGNWGLNTKLNLNYDGPIHLYYHDFDENGVTETLMTYNDQGKYYPLNTKDELAAQMNVINKIYRNHQSFAGKTIEEILAKSTIEAATKYDAHQLASGYLRNDNGRFVDFIELPMPFQLAPINAFSKLDFNESEQLLVGGNSFKVNTYHGSYTALKGLLAAGESQFTPVSDLGMQPFHNQVQQIESVRMTNKTLIIILFNNDEIALYSYQN